MRKAKFLSRYRRGLSCRCCRHRFMETYLKRRNRYSRAVDREAGE